MDPNDKSVISCPCCQRLYGIERDCGGKLAQCGACGCPFVIAIADPVAAGEALLLNNPLLGRYFNFFGEGVGTMAVNIRELLTLAGIEVTPRSILDVANSLPDSPTDLLCEYWRSRPCNQALAKVHERFMRDMDYPGLKRLLSFFCEHFPARDRDAKDMLIAAFNGVLSTEMGASLFERIEIERHRFLVDELRFLIRDELERHAKKPRRFGWLGKAVGP